jgi:hypothetical protein
MIYHCQRCGFGSQEKRIVQAHLIIHKPKAVQRSDEFPYDPNDDEPEHTWEEDND